MDDLVPTPRVAERARPDDEIDAREDEGFAGADRDVDDVGRCVAVKRAVRHPPNNDGNDRALEGSEPEAARDLSGITRLNVAAVRCASLARRSH